jgi:hypothetical protein
VASFPRQTDMKYRYSIALISLFTFGCSSDNTMLDNSNKVIQKSDLNLTENSFEKYLKSLDKIQLPLKYSALESLPDISKEYDQIGFRKFNAVGTNKPLGILNSNDRIVTLVYCSDANMLFNVPIFVTYNIEGKKLDSLGPFTKTGDDMGYHAMEYMTIDNDREIMMVDTVETYSLTPDESAIIPTSRKISFGQTIYKIDDKGRFEVKASH